MTQDTAIKSKRMAYDVDKRCVKTLSSLEAARTNQVFSKIEDVLSKSGYEIRGRYVSVGDCECSKHRQTRFIIELNSKEIATGIIHEIEGVLEVLKDIEFANIVTRHERRKT